MLYYRTSLFYDRPRDVLRNKSCLHFSGSHSLGHKVLAHITLGSWVPSLWSSCDVNVFGTLKRLKMCSNLFCKDLG